MKIITSVFTYAALCIALAGALDFRGSSWIWTNELVSPGAPVPIGTRAFRRFIPSPQGVVPVLATVLITADDEYTLFVNGIRSGATPPKTSFTVAQYYCVALSSPCGTLIAVTAVNLPSVPYSAGLLVKVEITYDDGRRQITPSDARWKAFNTSAIPSDYNQFFYDDSGWPNAVTEGVNGSPPWLTIVPPLSPSCTQAV